MKKLLLLALSIISVSVVGAQRRQALISRIQLLANNRDLQGLMSLQQEATRIKASRALDMIQKAINRLQAQPAPRRVARRPRVGPPPVPGPIFGPERPPVPGPIFGPVPAPPAPAAGPPAPPAGALLPNEIMRVFNQGKLPEIYSEFGVLLRSPGRRPYILSKQARQYLNNWVGGQDVNSLKTYAETIKGQIRTTQGNDKLAWRNILWVLGQRIWNETREDHTRE